MVKSQTSALATQTNKIVLLKDKFTDNNISN